jgi:hypothetical protein
MRTPPCSGSTSTRSGVRSRATSAHSLSAPTAAAAPPRTRAHAVGSSGAAARSSLKLGCVHRSIATNRRPSPSPRAHARTRFGWSIAARAATASRSRRLAPRDGSLGSREATAPVSCPSRVDRSRTLPDARKPVAGGCSVMSPGVVEGHRLRLWSGRRRSRRGWRLVDRSRRRVRRRGGSNGRRRSGGRRGRSRHGPWSIDGDAPRRLGALHLHSDGRGLGRGRRERRQVCTP